MSQDKKNSSLELEADPLEAIFALNMGDFMTEHLISKDLLSKIDTSVKDKITRLKGQLQELISIYSLDKTLTLLGFDTENEHIIYNAVAKTIAQMLNIDICRIYIDDVQMGVYGTEEDYTPFNKMEIPLANNWASIGTIKIENEKEIDLAPELIELLESTANLFVTSIRLQKLIEQSEEAIDDKNADPSDLRQLRTELTASIGDLGDEQQKFVEVLAKAVDIKSHAREHSRNVADLAREIAEHLELNEKTTDLIYYAGLLHNIGQISLPEDILSSRGKLDKVAWEKLQNHPNIGVSLLMKINFLSEVIPYVHYHKERWDGKGVPEGLSGMSIPLGARIIAVADAYQAMISERPYRKPMDKQEVLTIIKEEAGTKWDPLVVNALAEIQG